MHKDVIYFLKELAGRVPYGKRKFKGNISRAFEANRLLELLEEEPDVPQQ
jgi:hypothetical protein